MPCVDEPQTVVISDRDKGLLAADDELKHARRAYCYFHISQNIAQHHGQAARSAFWELSRAYDTGAWEKAIAKLKLTGDGLNAHDYVLSIDTSLWAARFFPGPRYGHTTSNIAESVNASLRFERRSTRADVARSWTTEKQKLTAYGYSMLRENLKWARTNTGRVNDIGKLEVVRGIRVAMRCCMLGPEDEIWLYGFSRGAYVVRAVAGLLHYLRALVSANTPSFKQDYSEALEVYKAIKRRAFDTVKAVNDRSLYDISFNDSVQHLRHALALNEQRTAMSPEHLFPPFERTAPRNRSIFQAWFVGAHGDMGGSEAKDGLSLYPLQWMLLESRSKGLVLEFDASFSKRIKIDNPLDVVFPEK
ncbi:MAG: hypothetical protein M1816_001384 [Peltula sp. TS41687]|nr:MAG: hypothetical protein M1816_001384 [Peltula sp. TS41687]